MSSGWSDFFPSFFTTPKPSEPAQVNPPKPSSESAQSVAEPVNTGGCYTSKRSKKSKKKGGKGKKRSYKKKKVYRQGG